MAANSVASVRVMEDVTLWMQARSCLLQPDSDARDLGVRKSRRAGAFINDTEQREGVQGVSLLLGMLLWPAETGHCWSPVHVYAVWY